jgi:hypothetical protein
MKTAQKKGKDVQREKSMTEIMPHVEVLLLPIKGFIF